MRVPEITHDTRTSSYHRPNKTRGSYFKIRDDATTSTALVPVRTGTNIPERATTVCTGAKCVRVPESTDDTRTGSYLHRTSSAVLYSYEYEYTNTLLVLPYVEAPDACAYLKHSGSADRGPTKSLPSIILNQ